VDVLARNVSPAANRVDLVQLRVLLLEGSFDDGGLFGFAGPEVPGRGFQRAVAE
jgi:hypothetical protein